MMETSLKGGNRGTPWCGVSTGSDRRNPKHPLSPWPMGKNTGDSGNVGHFPSPPLSQLPWKCSYKLLLIS